jgi:tRNA (cytosine40_48-C5)-methyltransferase
LKTFVFPNSPISSILAQQYGYHEWLINRFLQFVPDVKGFLEKMEREPQLYIRVNTLKINTKDLKEKLVSKGFELDDIGEFGNTNVFKIICLICYAKILLLFL